jgi:superfamily II DNA or RNA helicase
MYKKKAASLFRACSLSLSLGCALRRAQVIMARGAADVATPYGLKPHVRVRDYQEKALFGMFGAAKKARSGIIVLPCGAGKTLVGISAAVRVGRSTVVLCNNNAAVEQWHRSFLDFTDIPK